MKKMKEMKQRAKALIRKGNTRLSLTVLGIFLVFATFLPLLLGVNLSGILFGTFEGDAVDSLVFSVWVTWSIFVTAPVLTLLYRRAYLLYLRAKDGFAAPLQLSHCGVWKCFFSGLLLLIRPALIFGLFRWAYELTAQTESWLYFPIMLGTVAVSVLVMWLTSCLFLFPYYVCQGKSIGYALKNSIKKMLHHLGGYFGYMLAFLGWILLSLLTAGILLVLYTIPMMLFTYFIFADKIVGDQQTEDDRHE